MKVVFVTTSFLVGGLERSSANLANFLCKQPGLELVVITQYKFKHFYQLDERIRVIEPDFKKEGVSKLLYYLKIVFFFRKHIKNLRPDVVLSFGEYCNFQVLLAGLNLNVPIVISDRASPILKIAFPTNLFRKITYPWADGFIAQTERMKQSLILKFGIKSPIEVIQNAVRKVELYPELNRRNQIIAVGRIHPIKQFDKLIEAFETAKTEDWELLIIGDGVDRNKILNQIENSSKRDFIKFVSKTLEIDKHFAESKVFVLTSQSEGFPNSLCEAMAAGLICLSFDIVAGPREIIQDGVNGLLVPEGDFSYLSNRISAIIDNETNYLHLGKNALKLSNNLSVDKIGIRYFEFLKKQINS